jgi:dihydroorotase
MRSAKQTECCSAGVFGGATALQTYVQVFDEAGALDKLEAFASLNGARFYGLPSNTGTIELIKRPNWQAAAVAVGEEDIVIFRGGEELPWSIGKVKP